MPDEAVILEYGSAFEGTPTLEARRGTSVQESRASRAIHKIASEELERIRKGMLRAAFKVTRNFCASGDIAQETWAKLLRKIADGQLDNIQCIEAYAVSVAKNVAINWRRAERRCVSLNDMHDLLAENSDPYDWVCTAEEVSQWLNRLPESIRDPLVLCRVYGYTAEECAAMLGISVEAVWKRVGRALVALKALSRVSSRYKRSR